MIKYSFAVIVPTLNLSNVSSYLNDLVSQDYPNLVIGIVFQGNETSFEEIFEYIKKKSNFSEDLGNKFYAFNLSNFKVFLNLEKENLGYSHNLNKMANFLIKIENIDFLCFSNDDIKIEDKSFFKKLNSKINMYPADIYSPNIIGNSKKPQITTLRKKPTLANFILRYEDGAIFYKIGKALCLIENKEKILLSKKNLYKLL